MIHSMKSILIATMLFSSTAVAAGEIKLTKEIQGASLHEDGVDMVVYYTKEGEIFEVVATYLTDDSADGPARIRMGLMNSDRVTFALPGRPEMNYTFFRHGSTVRVETTPTGAAPRLAKANGQ